MAQQPNGTGAPSLGGLLNTAWDYVTGTFRDWVDDEIGGAELALENTTTTQQAAAAAAAAPVTPGATVGGLPFWLLLGAGGLIVASLLLRG